MRPRIVILSAFLTPFRSGAEACAEEVASCLKNEFNITIVTARMHKSLPHLDRLPSGVRIWRVGLGNGFDKWLYPFLAPRAARALKPDLIHAVLETFAGLALMFCKSIGVPRILTLQTTNRSFLKGPIVRSPDRVTAISSVLVDAAKKLGRNDVTLIPNGVNVKMIEEACAKHPKKDGHIVFVGRLEPMKGVDTLLTAFASVVGALSDNAPTLHIVGDGSQRGALERLAKDLGIEHRVMFVGFVLPQEVASAFAQATIAVGLSRSEALGNVFLEAQAAGCAVLATHVGGIPEIVRDDVTGLLIPPNDPAAAAEKLHTLLHDTALRQRLAEAGKKHAHAFDWALIAKRYAAVYTALLSSHA